MDTLKNLQYKVNKLEALLDSSKLLNSTQDTNYILDLLLKESLSFITGGQAVAIFLYNEETGYLEAKSYYGFHDEIKDVRIFPGESITGKTFKEKKSFFLKNFSEVSEYMKNMSPSNTAILSNISYNVFPKVNTSISCPLLYQDKCFGVIIVDGFEDDLPLTIDDLTFLESISVQASIAINNSINFEKEIRQSNSLQHSNKIIEHQNDKLAFSLDLNNKLTAMLLKGCNIQDILFELKSLINHDFFILTPFFNIRDSFISNTEIESLIKKSKSIFSTIVNVTAQSNYTFEDAAINIIFYPFSNNLGWLGVIFNDNKITKRNEEIIKKVITVLTIELMKENSLNAMEIKHKGDFFDSLIAFENIEYINKMLQYYGYNSDREHVIIVASVKNEIEQSEAKRYLVMQNIFLYYSTEFNKMFTNTIILLKGQEVIFLVEINKYNKDKIIKENIEQLIYSDKIVLDTIINNNNISIGVSNNMKELSDFKVCYHNALHTIKLNIKTNNNSKIAFYSDFKIKKLFMHNDIDYLKLYVDEVLGPLMYYSNSSNQGFMETLQVYIKSNGNWSYTKGALFIHGNTLTYRLKRIQEILDLKLNNYEDRLKIQLSLEILEILELSKI